MKTLTDISAYTEYIAKLNDLFVETNENGEPQIIYPTYAAEDFLKEVYMEETDYNTLVAVLKKRRRLSCRVLQVLVRLLPPRDSHFP